MIHPATLHRPRIASPPHADRRDSFSPAMRVRALALRLHLVIGVLTGAGLLVLGLSGAVLVLRPDFEGSQSAELAPAPSGAPAPSLDALLEAARRRHPGFVVTSLSLPGGDAAARVGMLDTTGGALEVLIDPRSGRIAGSHWAERSPLHALRLLHTELYLGARGRVIVGLLGLWLVLQGMTGLYLWWPLMKRPRWGFTVRWARPWPVMGRDLQRRWAPPRSFSTCPSPPRAPSWASPRSLRALSMRHRRFRRRLPRSERVTSRRWRERPSEPCREPASPHFGFCPALSWR